VITNDQSSVSGEGLWEPSNIGDDVVAEGAGDVVGQVINWPIASCDKCLDNKPNESNLQQSSKLTTASLVDSLRESMTLLCVQTTTGLFVTCARMLCNVALLNDSCIEIVPEL
jgi:hypothetical protein